MSKKSNESKRIVFFDDSKKAVDKFKMKMEKLNVKVLSFRSSLIDEAVLEKILNFKPQLFVVDLLIGDSKVEGYDIIKKINKSGLFKNIPIVVCSKFINETQAGLREKNECLSFPGVVDAFSKFPDFPPGEEFLKYISKINDEN